MCWDFGFYVAYYPEYKYAIQQWFMGKGMVMLSACLPCIGSTRKNTHGNINSLYPFFNSVCVVCLCVCVCVKRNRGGWVVEAAFLIFLISSTASFFVPVGVGH